MKRRGWYGDSWRHSLSAKGMKNAYYTKKQAKRRMIEITAEKTEPGKVYPMTKEDAKKIMAQQNPDDVKGLKAVRFEEPKNKMQKGAWAQYKRGKREIAIFAQPENEVTPQVHMMMKKEVVPHEIGHHVALTRRNITDPDLRVAEARADAFAKGFDVEDKDVEKFVVKEHVQQGEFMKRRSSRRYNYTPTFVAGDLPLIVADGAGTVGAAAIPLIPIAVLAGGLYVGAKVAKNEIDKSKGKK